MSTAQGEHVARVAKLLSYPIKGCAGMPTHTAVLTPAGITHDRSFMVTSEEGIFRTQRRHPRLALTALRSAPTENGSPFRWPAERRAAGVAFEVHRILEKLADRFERILDPPENPHGGEVRWTCDTAKRLVGWQVDTPQTAQEKIEAIHDLAADEQVAAQVATDLLRRPEVAFHAARDEDARDAFNRAWLEADEWPEDDSADVPGRESSVVPAFRARDRTLLFLDWKKACHQLILATHDLVPALQDEQMAEDVQEVIEQGLARLRAACDWVAHALATGEIDRDEELACLLHDTDGSRAGEDEEKGDDEDGDGGAGVRA